MDKVKKLIMFDLKNFLIVLFFLTHILFANDATKDSKRIETITNDLINTLEISNALMANTVSKEEFLAQSQDSKTLLRKILNEFPLKSGLNEGMPESLKMPKGEIKTAEADFKHFLREQSGKNTQERLALVLSCKMTDSKTKMLCHNQKILYVFQVLMDFKENVCDIAIIADKGFETQLYKVVYFAFYDEQYDRNLAEEYNFSRMYYIIRELLTKYGQCLK